MERSGSYEVHEVLGLERPKVPSSAEARGGCWDGGGHTTGLDTSSRQ